MKKRFAEIMTRMAVIGMSALGMVMAGCGKQEMTDVVEESGSETILALSENEGQKESIYKEAMNNLNERGILPDGEYAYVKTADVTDALPNQSVLYDIDKDGVDELMISVGGTCMADTCLYIFQYNEESRQFFRELAVWPAVHFYSNGLAVIFASHNHGYSCNPDFWPYDICQYHLSDAEWQKIFEVDAWEKEYYPVDYDGNVFPDEADMDYDGMVYRITKKDEDEVTILDGNEYEAWLSELIGNAEVMELSWTQSD